MPFRIHCGPILTEKFACPVLACRGNAHVLRLRYHWKYSWEPQNPDDASSAKAIHGLSINMEGHDTSQRSHFLTPAQEMRDQIYGLLLTSTYRVNLAPLARSRIAGGHPIPRARISHSGVILVTSHSSLMSGIGLSPHYFSMIGVRASRRL